MLVIGIGTYARSGIDEVVDLLAAVHYISRCAAIWEPPKSLIKLSALLTLRVHPSFEGITGKNRGIGERGIQPSFSSETKTLVSTSRLKLKHHVPDCSLYGRPGLRRF